MVFLPPEAQSVSKILTQGYFLFGTPSGSPCSRASPWNNDCMAKNHDFALGNLKKIGMESCSKPLKLPRQEFGVEI
jgi:hypothetical protein